MPGTDGDYDVRPDHCPGRDGLAGAAGVLGFAIHLTNISKGWAGLYCFAQV